MTIQNHVILAPFTTFGIGGPADYFVEITTAKELVEAIELAREKSMPYFILGSGANILVGDKGFRGLIIKNKAESIVFSNELETSKKILKQGSSDQIGVQDDKKEVQGGKAVYLTADAGVTIAELIDITSKKGLSGLEHFIGIPSTLGGALWQNLHFLSSDRTTTVYIGDIVVGATILTESGEIREVDHDYFQFGYDNSILHTRHDIVIAATLQLIPEDPTVIEERIAANRQWRNEKQPFEAWKNSAGSIFKKLGEHGAGRLVEQVGLKGYKIGGAMVSEKHANFIINTGGATAKDVTDLIALITKKVKEKLGLDMQVEISMVGEF